MTTLENSHMLTFWHQIHFYWCSDGVVLGQNVLNSKQKFDLVAMATAENSTIPQKSYLFKKPWMWEYKTIWFLRSTPVSYSLIQGYLYGYLISLGQDLKLQWRDSELLLTAYKNQHENRCNHIPCQSWLWGRYLHLYL